MPTAVAIQWVEVTTPNVPSISGRVVKGLGLMLAGHVDPARLCLTHNHSRGVRPTRFSGPSAQRAALEHPTKFAT